MNKKNEITNVTKIKRIDVSEYLKPSLRCINLTKEDIITSSCPFDCPAQCPPNGNNRGLACSLDN